MTDMRENMILNLEGGRNGVETGEG
jgi:hypothetical protein